MKLPENSNKIRKTNLTKEMILKKNLKTVFWIWKRYWKINCTNRAPLGVSIYRCFW